MAKFSTGKKNVKCFQFFKGLFFFLLTECFSYQLNNKCDKILDKPSNYLAYEKSCFVNALAICKITLKRIYQQKATDPYTSSPFIQQRITPNVFNLHPPPHITLLTHT